MDSNKLKMKVLAIVTGASRGFGYSIVKELIKKTTAEAQASHIDFKLYARSLSSLESTEKLIKELLPQGNKIDNFAIDFSDIEQSEATFKKSLENVSFGEYQKVIFFNNHGSLSFLQRIDSLTNFIQIKKDLDMNITSFLVTSSIFLSKIREQNTPLLTNTSFFLVNSSSLAGIKPFDTWGIYCTTKAAREMLLRVISEESKSIPNIKTLNYSPGAMDTDMQGEVRANTIDEESKKYFVNLKEEGKLVDPFKSAAKMMVLLFENTFESAAHLDYHDLPVIQ
ncbi:sepiapterin reductase [Cavenderia fasciculata]|uniref:Sepiapterin reductase n=1 Tax=Cavenderia fasciculata TaxID=261658 RepID=F4PQN4_CACFS|nr:sepiapterin reductase [Cavenderia fasciculata]EGG21201.1 sepiapterin reductase [Cavenderia fasciculata]|eukprot:XP_004359051.1 sepiapterin reductase [Cavenderia fasciculata]